MALSTTNTPTAVIRQRAATKKGVSVEKHPSLQTQIKQLTTRLGQLETTQEQADDRLVRLAHIQTALSSTLHKSLITMIYCHNTGIVWQIGHDVFSFVSWLKQVLFGLFRFGGLIVSNFSRLVILAAAIWSSYELLYLAMPWLVDHCGSWLSTVAFVWINAIVLAIELLGDILKDVAYVINVIVDVVFAGHHISSPPKNSLSLLSMKAWNKFWDEYRNQQSLCANVDTLFAPIILLEFVLTANSVCPFVRFAQYWPITKWWLPEIIYFGNSEFYNYHEMNCDPWAAIPCVLFTSYRIFELILVVTLVVMFCMSEGPALIQAYHVCLATLFSLLHLLEEIIVFPRQFSRTKWQSLYKAILNHIAHGEIGEHLGRFVTYAHRKWQTIVSSSSSHEQ